MNTTTTEAERVFREVRGAPEDGARHRESIRDLRAWVARQTDAQLVRAIRRPKNLEGVPVDQLMTVLLDHRRSVIAEALDCLAKLRLPSCLRSLYLQGISDVHALSQVSPCLPAIDLCAAVALSEGSLLAVARPPSVAGLFYYVGISLFDDVIDKDLEPGWTDAFSEEQISFASIGMFTGLASMALSDLLKGNCGDVTISRMRRWLYDATYEMATGQYLDVRINSRNATLAMCEEINRGKTGSTGELAAKFGALVAGAPETRLVSYGEASRRLYVSMQISSDIQDVWCKPLSPDLMNGIMTVPIVYALGNLPAAERGELEKLLALRSNSRETHERMRNLLSKSGALGYSLVAAEQHRLAALDGFESLADNAGDRSMLRYFCAAARLVEIP